MQYIVFQNEAGGTSVVVPDESCGLTIEEIAKISVPDGVDYSLVYEDGLPQEAPPLAAYESAIQDLVDETPKEKAFRDGVTMASYVASTNPQWAAEAQAFVAWRDGVWAYAYAELAKVQAGDRAQPSVEAFLSEIDPIEWPV